MSRIKKWISGEYIHISIHDPIEESSYIKLPIECFRWFHMRHCNLRNKGTQSTIINYKM